MHNHMATSVDRLFRIDGKRAVITGGANGIGYAIANALAAFGASVMLVDRDVDALKRSLDSLHAQGYSASSTVCDLSKPADVEVMLSNVETSGGVDIFFNSAAVTNRKETLEMTEAEWKAIIDINLNGAYRVGRGIAGLMIRQQRKGRIVFIVSTGAYRASPSFGAYSASKAGVVMLAKTLALELAPFGILVNAIAPTATDTNFTAEYYAAHPDKREAVAKNHPLGRIAVAEDYMGTAVYLASEASAFVTGTLLVVDGGKTAK